MQNPVEIERRFQNLCSELESVSSLRMRWHLIADFISAVSYSFDRFDTYLIQLAQMLPVFEHPLSYVGSDPGNLMSILKLLDECEESVPKLKDNSHYIKARKALAEATALSFAFVGEFEQLIELYNDSIDSKELIPSSWIEEVHRKENADNLYRLQMLSDRAKDKGNRPFGNWLESLYKKWQKAGSGEKGTLFIPVVESQSKEEEYKQLGRLRELSTRITGEVEKEHDHFSNNFTVIGAEKSFLKETENISHTVRIQLDKTHSHLKEDFFDILIRYRMDKGWQSGASSELGAALSSYCSILDFTGQRSWYSVRPNLAVTGRLGKQGKVLAVDEAGIGKKVEAAFFSWIEVMVVPLEQKNLFEKRLSELREKYPRRDEITLIGTGHFRELFYDRRITGHKIESRSKYYLRRAWQNKFSVAGTFIIIILLLLVAWFIYGPIDKNPVNGVFKGERLFVENQYGQTVVELDAGYRSDFDAQRASAGGASPQVQFVDINADNINEVIWATNMSRSGEEIEYFKCWSVTGDSLVWQRPAFFNVDFPRKSGMVDNHFFIGELLRATLPDGKTYIVSRLAMREMFPGLVILMDPSTGRVESKYIHAGQVNGLELVDINGDGVSEVLISGINNAFATAFAAALELQNIGGHSPIQGDYEIEGVEQADELHYLLIPKTKVGQYLDPIERYNRSGEINFAKEDSLISVWVRDGQAHAFEGIQRSLRVIAHFDFDFMPQGFSTSDQYDIVAEELYQEGKIESFPDYDYFEAFKDSILYWNGEQFILSKNRDL